MAKILGIYKDYYQDVTEESDYETSMSRIYRATNKKTNMDVCLKVISEEKD